MHSYRHSLLIVVAMFVATTATARPARSDDADPEMSAILERLQDWRKSFATIRVTWREWHREYFIKTHPDLDPDKELGTNFYSQYEFIWSDIGAFRKELNYFEAGKVIYRSAEGGDGDRRWEATVQKGSKDTDNWTMLELFRPDRAKPLKSNIGLPAIWGLWNDGAWVGSQTIGTGNLVLALAGFEDVDGQRCALVKRTQPSGAVESYWFDPAHAFLPRKYEIYGFVERRQGRSQQPSHWYTWHVTEFREIDGRLWFPVRGDFVEGKDKSERAEWIVDAVVLNEPLPRATFVAPEPTSRTKISDQIGDFVDPRTSARKAPEPTPDSAANNTLSSPTTTLGFQVPDPSSYWMWIGFIGASAVALGLIIRWRRRAQRQ